MNAPNPMHAGGASIPAAYALAHTCPEFWQSLTPAEQVIAQYDLGLWLRPEQIVPQSGYVSFGFLCGRGYGKTLAFAHEINRRVEAGEVFRIGLAAPSEDRIQAVQQDALVTWAPPWCPAIAVGKSGVKWANGAEAIGFTPQEPGRPRSSNFELSWMTEIVDWNPSGAKELYSNLSTATRTPGAVSLWDTTSKGRNEVVQILLANNAANPAHHRIVRGSMLDSTVLDRPYIASQFTLYPPGTREHDEEILGLSFQEATGARWDVDRIDAGRVEHESRDRERVIISVDPALTKNAQSDEVGMLRIARDPRQDAFIERDFSGKHSPEDWCELVLDEHARGACAAVIEVNHAGDFPHAVLRVLGETRESRGRGENIRIEVLDHASTRPIPPYRKGLLWVKEIVSRDNKDSRAAAASSLYAAGRVHHVGRLGALEMQMVSWEPGQKSPNRLDALTQGLIELLDVRESRERPKPLIEQIASAALANATLGGGLVGHHRSARDGFRRRIL